MYMYHNLIGVLLGTIQTPDYPTNCMLLLLILVLSLPFVGAGRSCSELRLPLPPVLESLLSYQHHLTLLLHCCPCEPHCLCGTCGERLWAFSLLWPPRLPAMGGGTSGEKVGGASVAMALTFVAFSCYNMPLESFIWCEILTDVYLLYEWP